MQSSNHSRWQQLLSSTRQGAGQALTRPERTAFQQDYDRIVFSSAFRRLKDKTQVFPLSKSDYVRTRLTHSLEASCVGRSLGILIGREIIGRHQLTRHEASDFGAITAAACLAHDIGNPPFGHAGEDAIREWFVSSHLLKKYHLSAAQHADFVNYEGNAQGFRTLTRLQGPSNPGLQLTRAVLATFSKYPRASDLGAENNNTLEGASAKKFGFFQHDAESFSTIASSTGLIERVSGCAWHRHPLSFLVEVADDVCYLIVDLEDAARLGFVSYKEAEQLLANLASESTSSTRMSRLYDDKERLEYLRAKAIGHLVDKATEAFLDLEIPILEGTFDDDLLSVTSCHQHLQDIRELSNKHIYSARPALEIETAGFEVLGGLLDLFCNAVEASAGEQRQGTREHMLLKLIPSQFLLAGNDDAIDSGSNAPQVSTDPYLRMLSIADFISGMTDSYAVDLYRKLKGIDLPG